MFQWKTEIVRGSHANADLMRHHTDSYLLGKEIPGFEIEVSDAAKMGRSEIQYDVSSKELHVIESILRRRGFSVIRLSGDEKLTTIRVGW